MKSQSFKKSLTLAGIACLLSPSAHSQILAIDSVQKLNLLPMLREANPAQEEHALARPQGKMVYSKVELVFGGQVGAVLKDYSFNSLNVTLNSRYFAPGSATGRLMPIPSLFNGANQEFTLLSVVPDMLSVLSLRQGFSGRATSDAIVQWSRGSALLLIEGGEAWRILRQLPSPKAVLREQAAGLNHEIVLSGQGQVVCSKETFAIAEVGPVSEVVTCLISMARDEALNGSFDWTQIGVNQQQQQQQRQQQPQQQQQRQQQTHHTQLQQQQQRQQMPQPR